MIKKSINSNAIIIDGVVGVGKTTLMDLLSEELHCQKFIEPVSDNPILSKFYYDRKRYSFALQIFFLNRRFKMLKESAAIKDITVMDRSIYGDLIFAKLIKDVGDMDEEEFSIYHALLTNMLEHVMAPKLMIYLRTDSETAIQRIKKRGRDYEQVVERSYWENLNQEYEAYFSQYNLSKLLVIDASQYDFVNNEQDKLAVLALIKNTLND